MEIVLFAIVAIVFFQICLRLVHVGVRGIVERDIIAYRRFSGGTHYHGLLAVFFGIMYIVLGMAPSTALAIAIYMHFAKI